MSETASKKQAIREVNINDIGISFYVRKAPDLDRVVYFGELYESGADVPPLEINAETNELVDGRHRLEGAKLVNLKVVPCELKKFKSREDMIQWALKANSGGPLPPKNVDIDHTIEMFLEEGLTRKKIVDIVTEALHSKPQIVIKHINNVQSAMAKKRLLKAVREVAEGQITSKAAAEKHNVRHEALKQELSGSKKKKRKSVLGDIKSALTVQYKGRAHKNSYVMKSAIESYETGEMDKSQVLEVFDHLAQLIKRLSSTVDDYRKRFETQTAK